MMGNKILHLNILQCFTIASLVTPLCRFVETYIFSDWQFLIFLVILISIDTLMGLLKAWKELDLSSKRFSKVFVKVIVYMGFLSMTHVLTHFTIENEPNKLFAWVDAFCYSAIVLRESLSILENIALINKDLIPIWVIKRFKYFDETGQIKSDEPGKDQ